MPRRAVSALVLALLAAAGVACSGPSSGPEASGPVQGEGELVTEDRTAGEVERVSVGSGMTVSIITGPQVKVTVTAQSNVLPLVSTEVIDGQLVANIEPPGISADQPVTLTVVAPDIESVALSGGAYGAMDTSRDSIALDVSGGAVIEAAGRTGSLELAASTGARALLGQLAAGSATVNVSEGAQAELNVSDVLTGEATGGATIRLTVTPATVDVQTGSGGSVVGAPAASG